MQLCVDYMLKHISKSATQGYLVCWLHYTISFSPYHQEVTDALQRFLKWNLDIVAEAKDFVDLDINILIVLLQQNDLVLKNEFILFGYIENWLTHKYNQLKNDSTINADDVRTTIQQMIESLVVHIRFAMMTPNEFAKLLMKPISKLHTKFFADRISIGMSYHSGQDECVARIRATELGKLQFTPRLYTSDTYGLSMQIQNFENIENYQTFGACFFSQSNLSEYQEGMKMLFYFASRLYILIKYFS